MKVQNIVRKAVALGSGAALVGTTLMGAFAYDLSTYPAKFIVDGKFDGKIVVGEKAATPDVIGAIDIAASLQGASVSKVAIPGAAGTVSLDGDNFQLQTSSDMLELREPLNDVVDTITSDDLAGLKGGKITTPEGSTNYAQYLRLQDTTNSSALQEMNVNYVQDTKASDRAMGDYLVVTKSLPFIEWEIQFDEGLESEVEVQTGQDSLKDLEDRTFNIMGTDFTVVSALVDNTTGANFHMELMGGSVPDTLREGETKTYTINGVDYEVTLVFVSDPNSGGAPEVKFSVNGELTQAMAESDTDVLSGGMQIGVRDILVNAREGVASFYLGAHKLTFDDPNTANAIWDGDIDINDEVDESNVLDVIGASTGTDTYEITSIKYKILVDPAASGSVTYIPSGKGVRELVKEPELLISDTLDLKYMGLTDAQRKVVSFEPTSGDEEYTISFTNIDGKEYSGIPLLSTSGALKFGEETDDLVFVESGTGVYNVGIDDYVIVTSKAGASAHKAVTNVLQYDSFEHDTRTVTFVDLASNAKVSSVLTDNTGEFIGTINVGGHSYAVEVNDTTDDDAPLALEMSGDDSGVGDPGDYAQITTWGGFVIDPLVAVTNGTALTMNNTNRVAIVGNDKNITGQGPGAWSVTMSGTVDKSLFDTAAAESFNWTFSENAAKDELDVSFDDGSYNGPLDGASPFDFQFKEETRSADVNVGMTDYGILVTETDPSDSNDAKTLELSIPEEQILAQVFVTMGDVSATEGGAGVADKVNPIAVGLAVLDKDAPAIGSDNLIVVGGPCANTVAAELMGNPESCVEGFTEGKAMIKAFGTDKVSILVAGYSAQDTLGASRVLADYKAYSLKGEAVEVVVADLKNIKVNAME